MITLNSLAQQIHSWARSKGFYDREVISATRTNDDGRTGTLSVVNPSMPAEKLMLIVSECSEVLDALRDDDRTHEAEEVADIMIRVLDYSAWREINLDLEVDKKMQKNGAREHLHGRTF